MPAVTSRRKGRRRTMSDINMVPFIDVMLVLLIIFMVTATLIAPSQIELPSVGQAARQPDRFVQVFIDAQGALTVQDSAASEAAPEPVNADTLAARVLQLQGLAPSGQAPVPVIISADQSVPYAAVIQAMDALQRAGVARVGLSVLSAR